MKGKEVKANAMEDGRGVVEGGLGWGRVWSKNCPTFDNGPSFFDMPHPLAQATSTASDTNFDNLGSSAYIPSSSDDLITTS